MWDSQKQKPLHNMVKAQRFIAYMPARVKWKDFWPTLGQSKGKCSNLKDLGKSHKNFYKYLLQNVFKSSDYFYLTAT